MTGYMKKIQPIAHTYLAEITAKATVLLTRALSVNKQAFRISLHKQLQAGLSNQRQVHASQLHRPVPGAREQEGTVGKFYLPRP